MDSELPYHVRVYLAELSRHFDRVVMLTNNDKSISMADHAFFVAEGIELLPVVNEGYDFGMWSKAVAALGAGLSSSSELCLANDSCLLIAPLDPFLAAARVSPVEAYGLTESHERGHTHLQSYFLLFKGNGVAAVCAFLKELRILDSYRAAVGEGEIALSRAMASQGLRLDSYFRTDPAFDTSPTILRAETLLRLGHPLLKRRLVRDRSEPLFRRLISWHGGRIGSKACRRLLASSVGMDRRTAKKLMAADARAERTVTWDLQWLRFKVFINALARRDRRLLAMIRPQPQPGVWLASSSPARAPDASRPAR